MNLNKPQSKLNTIKEFTQIKVNTKLPISLDNLDQVKLMIHEAKDDKELTKIVIPTIYLVEAKQALTDAKKKANDAIKEQQAKAKAIDLALADLEKEVKEAVLENVVVTKTPMKNKEGNVKSDEFGEVQFKESHNLDTNLFSYTAPSSKKVIDKDAIIKAYKSGNQKGLLFAEIGLVKETVSYEIDQDVLNAYIIENGAKKLPTKIVETEAKISIKGKDIIKKQKEILESLEMKEEE